MQCFNRIFGFGKGVMCQSGRQYISNQSIDMARAEG